MCIELCIKNDLLCSLFSDWIGPDVETILHDKGYSVDESLVCKAVQQSQKLSGQSECYLSAYVQCSSKMHSPLQ